VGPDPGAVAPPSDERARDAEDAQALYRALETQVVPLYYERGPDGLPSGWLALVRRALRTLAPAFSARRMLKQYVRELYAGDPGGREHPGSGS
jgi:starch phosphorylase